ncbi:unnamed protein product, partial [Prorocentrum cordatum]
GCGPGGLGPTAAAHHLAEAAVPAAVPRAGAREALVRPPADDSRGQQREFGYRTAAQPAEAVPLGSKEEQQQEAKATREQSDELKDHIGDTSWTAWMRPESPRVGGEKAQQLLGSSGSSTPVLSRDSSVFSREPPSAPPRPPRGIESKGQRVLRPTSPKNIAASVEPQSLRADSADSGTYHVAHLATGPSTSDRSAGGFQGGPGRNAETESPLTSGIKPQREPRPAHILAPVEPTVPGAWPASAAPEPPSASEEGCPRAPPALGSHGDLARPASAGPEPPPAGESRKQQAQTEPAGLGAHRGPAQPSRADPGPTFGSIGPDERASAGQPALGASAVPLSPLVGESWDRQARQAATQRSRVELGQPARAAPEAALGEGRDQQAQTKPPVFEPHPAQPARVLTESALTRESPDQPAPVEPPVLGARRDLAQPDSSAAPLSPLAGGSWDKQAQAEPPILRARRDTCRRGLDQQVQAELPVPEPRPPQTARAAQEAPPASEDQRPQPPILGCRRDPAQPVHGALPRSEPLRPDLPEDRGPAAGVASRPPRASVSEILGLSARASVPPADGPPGR